jgi:cytochrome c biogenesis protein CcmG/thiol:disulfide interchange protein DsbE
MSEQTPRRVAPIISVAIAAVMVFFIVILVISSNNKTENAATPLLLKPAPEITSTTYDGDEFLLSRRRGSWVVLNFFNSTCVPCKREHPELVKFFEAQQRLNGTGAELYTIVNDDDEQAVRDFFSESGGGWPIVHDEDANISVDYGVAQVPETWLISPTGVVAQRFTGQVTAELLGSAIATMTQDSGL